jgi:DNA adenine methylase
MRKSFTIHDLPKEERPREKMIALGARNLTDRELLVTLLGRGGRGESVVVTVERLLGRFRNLNKIATTPIKELTEIKGIGQAKATQIKAAAEIANRINGGHKPAEPFLKWAGGKNQLIYQYSKSAFFPPKFNKYLEPFLGGGAVFFHLRPKKAVLSDLNKDLINCYQVIKKQVAKLIEVLKEYQSQHKKDFYYKIRDDYNSQILNNIERVAAFIYLNKTGFNGLYRVNARGEFNVPIGSYKTPSIFDEDNLWSVSKLLKNTELHAFSFENILDYAKSNDFIYFDPPYYPLNKTSNFTSYTKDAFLEDEQEKLADAFRQLDKKGCIIMLSNSDTKFIKKLYKGYRIEPVRANRFINCVGDKRGPINELVILNY